MEIEFLINIDKTISIITSKFIEDEKIGYFEGRIIKSTAQTKTVLDMWGFKKFASHTGGK